MLLSAFLFTRYTVNDLIKLGSVSVVEKCLFIRLETKSGRILPLNYVIKYDMT